MEKRKRIGVLFSGGLDSTYLVWKNLKDGNEVVPIYIEISNNKIKTILEKNRIELLYKEFGKEYDGEQLKFIEYVLTVSVCANEDSLYFKQIPIWMLGIMFSQSMGLDEIQVGYVGNDDALPYLHDIKKTYKSYQSISNNLVPLKFPLKKKKKWQIAEKLPKQYLDLIISCENPTIIGSEDAKIVEYEPCGTCAPCRTIISSEYYSMGFPEIYNKKIEEIRVNELIGKGFKIINAKGVDMNESIELMPCQEPYQLEINFYNNNEVNAS